MERDIPQNAAAFFAKESAPAIASFRRTRPSIPWVCYVVYWRWHAVAITRGVIGLKVPVRSRIHRLGAHSARLLSGISRALWESYVFSKNSRPEAFASGNIVWLRPMRLHVLRSICRRRYWRPRQCPPEIVAANVLHRNFTATRPIKNGRATSRTLRRARAGSISQCRSISISPHCGMGHGDAEYHGSDPAGLGDGAPPTSSHIGIAPSFGPGLSRILQRYPISNV